jgi:hypothetical protein
MQEPLEIQFDVTGEDYLKFVRHAANHDPHFIGMRRRARRQAVAWMLVIGVAFFIINFTKVPQTRANGTSIDMVVRIIVAVMFSGAAVLAVFTASVLLPWAVRAVRGGYAGRIERIYRAGVERGELTPELGEFMVEASDSGLVVNGPRSGSVDSWANIRLVETDWSFLLYRSVNEAHIVPKRAFGSVAEADRFRRAINGWSARTGRGEIPIAPL